MSLRASVRSLRRRWQMWLLDHQLGRHCRATRRELARRLGPYARCGDGLAPTMRRVPADEREAVAELLRRVDLGPGGVDVDVADRLYDLLDAVAGGRR